MPVRCSGEHVLVAPSMEAELVTPPRQLKCPEAMLEVRAVPQMWDHQEQPIRTPHHPQRQRFHTESIVNVAHHRRCGRSNRLRKVGIVVDHDALTTLEKAPNLRHVRVFLRQILMGPNRVIIAAQSVVRIDEHQRTRLDSHHRLVEPTFPLNDSRRTIGRGEVGEAQHVVEVHGALRQHAARGERTRRTIAGGQGAPKAVVEVGVERPKIFACSTLRVEMAHLLAIEVEVPVGLPAPHDTQSMRSPRTATEQPASAEGPASGSHPRRLRTDPACRFIDTPYRFLKRYHRWPP